MDEFYESLINSNTYEGILSKRTVDFDFEFERIGWYFFVSPISGILKMKIIRKPDSVSANSSLLRFVNFKLIMIVGCEDESEIIKMYQLMCENLVNINKLQKHTLDVVARSKIKLSEPGVYDLELLQDTVNYVNFWKYGDSNPYFIFNCIDRTVFEFYYDQLDSTLPTVDDYLNDPFYRFMYDLDGFKINKEFVDDDIIKDLKIGNKYKCKVDYFMRSYGTFNPIVKQLGIKRIYL